MTTATATVIGSGPNGLVAALTLARAGVDVTVYEAMDHPGGGLSTEPFGPPDARHVRDLGSAIHPMVLPSPVLDAWGARDRVEYAIPEVSYAQALVPGRAALAYRDIQRTADALGTDGPAWRRLLGPLAQRIDALARTVLRPQLDVPPHPLMLARFGLRALLHGTALGPRTWRTPEADALLTGVLAHAGARLPSIAPAAAGLLLAATAHADGWPVPLGGASVLANALVEDVEAHGGRIITGRRIERLSEVPADVVLADVDPDSLSRLAGSALPAREARALRRYRHGAGSAKLDLILDGPVPWAAPELAVAPTIHLGGSGEAMRRAENQVQRGRLPHLPYVLVAQPSAVGDRRLGGGAAGLDADPDAAADARHPRSEVLWAYTHVPNGHPGDPTERILRVLERHAPGVRNRVIHAEATSAAELARWNPNLVGGDVGAGVLDLLGALARPRLSPHPSRTGAPGVFLASAAVAPGPGVHGMSGYLAARDALAHLGLPEPFGLAR